MTAASCLRCRTPPDMAGPEGVGTKHSSYHGHCPSEGEFMTQSTSVQLQRIL